MQIRRFRAPDMRQAIRKVRDAVGPDAVILSNQRLSTGEIEIVAALDYDGSLPASMSNASVADGRQSDRKQKIVDSATDEKYASLNYKQRIAQAKVSSEQPATQQFDRPVADALSEFHKTAPNSSSDIIDESLSLVNASKDKKLKDMERELQQVKSLLQSQAKSSPVIDKNPQESKVRSKLKGLGIADSISTRLLDDIDLMGREDDWNRVLSHLAEHIPVRVKSNELLGCIAFMGPTGVGKTTTIGKIAAQHVLKYGNSSVVLVTTDTYRIAAHEQLRTFGRILGVPVVVVNEYSDLNDVLDKYEDYSLVLVDTAGMNPRDRNLERQLLMMKRARPGLKKLLVLPCTSQRQVLKTVVDVYSQVRLDGCVLSKLDESASLGEAISVVIEENLPVVYVADGQRIPDDIQPARAHNIISRAVYTAEQYSHIYSALKYGS